MLFWLVEDKFYLKSQVKLKNLYIMLNNVLNCINLCGCVISLFCATFPFLRVLFKENLICVHIKPLDLCAFFHTPYPTTLSCSIVSRERKSKETRSKEGALIPRKDARSSCNHSWSWSLWLSHLCLPKPAFNPSHTP